MSMSALVSFKAGRSERRADSNWVDSKPERGLFSLENEDGLLHLKWANLTTPTEEPLDLILFPGDATVRKASERVFVLAFSSSDSRSFFWFQDVSEAEDDRRIRRINALIDDVDAPEEPAGTQDADMATGSSVAFASAPAQPVDMAPDPSASAPVPGTGPSSADDQLRSILEQFAGQQQTQHVAPFTLNGILESSSMATFIAELAQAEIDELASFLPPDVPHDRTTLARVVASPEFKRSVAGFDAGLRTGGCGPVVTSLGLPQRASIGVEEYCAALKETSGGEGGSTGNMQID